MENEYIVTWEINLSDNTFLSLKDLISDFIDVDADFTAINKIEVYPNESDLVAITSITIHSTNSINAVISFAKALGFNHNDSEALIFEVRENFTDKIEEIDLLDVIDTLNEFKNTRIFE